LIARASDPPLGITTEQYEAMFVPKEMREINLFVIEQDIGVVTRTIARLGMLHLLDVSYLGERLPVEHADRRELIRSYSALDRRLEALLDSVAPARMPAADEVEAAPERSLDQLEDRVRRAEQEIDPVTERIVKVSEEVEYLAPLIQQLELLSPLDIAIEDLQTLDYLYLAAGSLPAANLDRLETSLFHLPHVILPFQEAEGHIATFVFAAKDQAEVLNRALRSAYFTPFELPVEFSGPLTAVLEQMRQKTSEFQQEKRELQAQLADLWHKWGAELLSLAKRARTERYLAEAMEHFGRTGHVYLIAGWIPEASLQRFMAQVGAVTEGRVIGDVNEPGSIKRAEQTIPCALDNPPLIRPFEQIITIYGQPSYDEIDPTPLLAVTFLLMFGMMFGDVGHGALLAVTGGLIASGLVPQLRSVQSFGSILLGCGLVSTLFGFLYGSLFGLEGILPPLWLSPLHSMLSLLIASVAFGVVVLNIGFLCNGINAWRARDWQNLLFSGNGLAGFLLYWAMLGTVISFARVIRLGIVPLLVVAVVAILVIALGEPLGNLLNRERPVFGTGLFSYLIQVFFELFETIIAFLSNTLSYVRLGAFAVAHIGLTSIVFILADLAQGVAPLRWLVIILGTLGVVAFEGLIVGIQTLRLEYYEFFNKFFRGVGIPYRPLSLPEA
jgi:V/A-type H+-transporting ATPase subunit I